MIRNCFTVTKLVTPKIIFKEHDTFLPIFPFKNLFYEPSTHLGYLNYWSVRFVQNKECVGTCIVGYLSFYFYLLSIYCQSIIYLLFSIYYPLYLSIYSLSIYYLSIINLLSSLSIHLLTVYLLSTINLFIHPHYLSIC